MIYGAFTTKYEIIDADRCFDIEMFSSSLIYFGCRYSDLDVQVTSSSIDAIMSLADKFDICTIFDTCWDFDFYRFFVFVQSSGRQCFAVFHKYLAHTITGSTDRLTLHDAKRRLHLLTYCPMTFAGFAGFFCSSTDLL